MAKFLLLLAFPRQWMSARLTTEITWNITMKSPAS